MGKVTPRVAGAGALVVAGAMIIGSPGWASAIPMHNTVVRATAAARGSVYVPAVRTLRFGMRGPAVAALQRRLNYLHYWVGKANGVFGWNTMEAVWAFKEVQSGRRIPRNPNIVGAAMQRQLRHPKLPKVWNPHGGSWRVEINKNIEVLVLYKRGKIKLISHVSTAAYCRPDGCGWVTPNGKHRALWFAAGWVTGPLGSMFNPVVFTPNGAYAMHGEGNPDFTHDYAGTPLYPASHGCVRLPWGISQFFHTLVHVSLTHGTPVYIHGTNR